MTKTVLLAQPIHKAGSQILHDRDDVEVIQLDGTDPAALSAALARAHGVVLRTTPLPAAAIAEAPNLEVVARHGVGYDAVDVDALTARGIPLTIAIDGNKVSVAELAMTFMLALAKNLDAFHQATRAGGFTEVRATHGLFDIAGKTLLIAGFGRIGREVAPRARAFGMNVVIYDPYVGDNEIGAAGYTAVNSLAEGLAQADIVTLHCPKNAETVDMLDAAALSSMKPGSLVINCARGGLVNEQALFEAINDGHIAGAGLDVFVDEPTPADNPLFSLDQVLVSPHVGGFSEEARQRSSYRSARNILDLFDGKLNPAVVVNPEVLKS